MAQFNVNEADHYGGQGGGGYFRLQNDQDTARVRFLYDSISDVTGYAVHEVKVGDKKRYVNCLREYGAPIDSCPLCKSGSFVTAKYFVPLFNMDTNRIETWERGKKFGSKLSGLCARYPHLVSQPFDIQRFGKMGDTATTYEIYPVGQPDDTTLEDFDIPNPLGTHVLDKSAVEMEYYLNNHEFPDADDMPVRRRSTAETDYEPRRRTPARPADDSF